jgi:chemotaxis protein CheY-P-specific phosphatase CheC
MNTRSRENFLIQTLNMGFNKAAISFSTLINRYVKIVNSQSILVRHENDYSYISEERGDLYVLITQIIGDITGKSFLIFSEDETQEIFKALNNATSTKAINEAFLLEIDNIISASVIAELSTVLGLEIYGDVPHLAKVHASDLQVFLSEISCSDPTSMIFCNTTFLFDKKERIHPQFIWKLSSKIFEMIPEQKVTA